MAPSLEQIAKEELEICRNIMDMNGPIKCLANKALPEFVERSLLLHRNLIERWDSCVWAGGPQDSVSNEDEAYRQQAAGEVWNEHRRHDPSARLHVLNRMGDSIYVNPLMFLANKLLDEHKVYGVDSLQGIVGGHRGIISVRPGQRISSLISRLVKHIRYETKKRIKLEMPDEYIRAWDGLCKELGERVWAAKSYPSAIMLSVRPSHFLSLGNLNEGGSCYKNGSQHDSSKVYLGADVPDSFVVLTYRGQKNIEMMRNTPFNPQGRAWGIALPGRGAVFTNFYRVTKKLLEKNVLEACEKGLGILGPGHFAANALEVRNHNAAFYTNADVTYYASVAGGIPYNTRELVSYLTDVLAYSSTAGKWTNNGVGPPAPIRPGPEPEQIMQENPAWRAEIERLQEQQRVDLREGRIPRPLPPLDHIQRWIVMANPNYGKIIPPPKNPPPPKLWPYKDFDLILGSPMRDGLFSRPNHPKLKDIAP